MTATHAGKLGRRKVVGRKGKARDVLIEYLKYHCGTGLVAPGGQTLEPLGLQAVLDSVSGVTGILERLLEGLREHFGGGKVLR